MSSESVPQANISGDVAPESNVDVTLDNGAQLDGDSSLIDPNASLTVRALVSTKEAGVIIGKAGYNVAELREKTGVKAGVSKVVQGVHDRVLSVSGNLEGVAKAYSLIAQTILENPVNASPPSTPVNPPASAITSVRLLISHNLMGTVIGRQGLKIKHIQDLSGARMVASKEMLPQSTERVVEVQGTTEAIRVAVYEIAKCLLEDWERGQGTVLYHPGQTEGAGVLAAGGAGGLQPQGSRRTSGGPAYLAGGMASMSLNGRRGANQNGDLSSGSIGFGGSKRGGAEAAVTPGGGLVAGVTPAAVGAAGAAAPAPPAIDSANLRTQNISIPSDMVGCIIGKGGSKITEIRRLSGSRISIAKVPHDETGERMFTIQGTPEANEKALFLLYNQLETEKERRTNNATTHRPLRPLHEETLNEGVDPFVEG
ncbi:hypothetical protein IE53DRAFT_34121 [Violaceomyces palustris]|uniref:Uncharacterized protein n=1 Tax=Violaceomyces palustris TaxID=1673888 RepID=A0ACD0P1D8_9BASI|nr:hypothetical protein IE53DRAFT_34121 [Violaceomyces palustris]